ncbi:MAG TPA: SDR family NAD(P)-dependent oxidoreductase, partial [Magnetospirillum sp.]|nr:SDR family NAD(P)-dependent oxidoreductase [Magnetospirillum sp.]
MDAADFDGAYVARNLRQPVLFAQGVATLLDEGAGVLIEISAHPVLMHDLNAAIAEARAPATAIASLGRDRGGWADLLANVAHAWTAGCPLRWDAVSPAAPWVDLPAYPWEGEALWLDPIIPQVSARDELPLLGMDWEDTPLDPAATLAAKRLPAVATAVIGVDGAERQAVEDALRAQGDTVAAPEDAERLIVASFASADPLEGGLFALDRLLRAERTPPRMVVLTRQQPGAVMLRPEDAALAAFARVAAAERPELSLRCIHVDGVTAETAGAIALEARMEDGPALVALVGGKRQVERLAPLPPRPAEPLDFTRPGVHVVTGGTSGIGLESAALLVRRGARDIALISRTGLDAANPLLAEMERAGARVRHYAADMADADAVAAALAAIRAQQGPVRGVIHAAGTSGNALIADSDRAAMEAVLAPKLRGALALANLTAADQPDYLLFHSSIAALFRSTSQATYAAANAGVDALARTLAAEGRRAVSVAWPIWRQTGRAAREGFTPDTAFLALDTAEGIA